MGSLLEVFGEPEAEIGYEQIKQFDPFFFLAIHLQHSYFIDFIKKDFIDLFQNLFFISVVPPIFYNFDLYFILLFLMFVLILNCSSLI